MISMPLKAILCGILLPAGLFFQMPARPGRLHIASNPEGARVVINGKAMPQQTNATFVVSPGQYTVEVTGGPGKLNCRQVVTVSSGGTVEVQCPSNK